MIVVDSSVWIAHLRGQETRAVAKLRAAIDQDSDEIAVGDLVLLEILLGARDEALATRIENDIRQFRVVRMLDDRTAVDAARHYRSLRRLGITIRKTTHLIIGTFCLRHGHTLLHEDKDFGPMEQHLGLRVA